jgi:hypothetical protein
MTTKNILYLDCPSGISGDMFLATMLDLGLSEKKLKSELKKLKLKGYTLKISKERRHAIEGTRFRVKTKKEEHHRTFKDIKKIIEDSSLSEKVKKLSIKIFKNLAIAEGKVHGIDYKKVHFHEVGAVDSIIDIVGAAIAIEALSIDKLYCSPVPTGSGLVKTAHGTMPIPAPATLELLKGIPLRESPITMELTTPTGAVILKTLSRGFGNMPAMVVREYGYGVGGKDFKEVPNVLRSILGNSSSNRTTDDGTGEAEGCSSKLIVIETNTDDMNPEIAPYLIERLLDEGALDAFITPILMKKGRPGVLITTLSEESKRDALTDILLTESTSIGVRYYKVDRRCLERRIEKIKTPYGVVRVKISELDGKALNIHPEFEDCKKLAKKHKVPLKAVMDAARCALKQ